MGEHKESIHWICHSGNKDALLRAIDNGVDLKKIDKFGYAPIHYSIISQNEEIFEILCDSGCKSNETSLKLSCLHIAIYFNRIQFLEKLVDQKNNLDINGETPVIYAARYHRNDFLMYLLKKGADVSITSSNGETALHAAVISGNVIGAAELIRYGSKITAVNKNMKSPFSNIELKINKKNIKSNIKIIYNPSISPVNEKLFKSTTTDSCIVSKGGRKFLIHKCVASKYTIPENLSDGALEIYVEWMYLQKSPILENQSIDSVVSEVVELLSVDSIKSYIATYIIKQKGVFPMELLKAFSNTDFRNKNVNLGRFIIIKAFEKFEQHKNTLCELNVKELANLIEALPLKEILLEESFPEPQKYEEEEIKPSEHDKKNYNMSEYNKKLCLKIINMIMTDQRITAFVFPVDEERDGAIGYYKIIKKPMCIDTIKNKINENKYKFANEFMSDLRLIWKNAMTYNRIGTLYYIIADELRIKCEGFWDKIPLSLKDEKTVVKDILKERKEEIDKNEPKEKRKIKKKVEEVITINEQPAEPIPKPKRIKKEKKTVFKEIEIKKYAYKDKERVMHKIEKLSLDQLKQIPNVLEAKETGESFELNLETMSDLNLTKLEAFCDSNL